MTYLQAVNAVLRRLREREVTSVNNNSYSRLIGDFVNDAKREVEDAWSWTHLKDTVQITTSAGVFRYTLTGAGRRARLMLDMYGNTDVFNDTTDIHLHKAPSTRWMSARLNDNDVTQNEPHWFDFNGLDGDDPQVDLYQIPDKAYSINFNMVIPQEDLDASSDDNTSIIVPSQPVVLGAWNKAIYERGEDQGYLSDLSFNQYRAALSDAIALDEVNTSDESIWWVV